tara:strand:- start:48 stop:239 length:192 start_codon:yes stop_codon:yes gene_type:complete
MKELQKNLADEIIHIFHTYPFADKRIFVADEDGEDVGEIEKSELENEIKDIIKDVFENQKDTN